MTFSVAARSADGSLFGIALASSSPAVAARCAHARAGVGAVASQNITDPALGAAILNEMSRGASAQEALDAVVAATPYAAYRQLVVVGRAGLPSVHSGAHTLGVHGTAVGERAAAAGNLLARSDVPATMLGAVETARGHFGDALMQALRAGLEHGGEAGPVHSAGLLIVREVSWPVVDLRVDWTEADPVAALEALWRLYAPQMDDYVLRAIDPGRAPSYAVPGDP